MKTDMVATTDEQARRAIYVVDRSGAADKLEALMLRAPQGRPRRLPLRTWLIGALLSVEHGLGFSSVGIYRALTGMSVQMQWDLKVRTRDRHGQVKVLNKAQIDYFAKSLQGYLVCTRAGADLYDHELTGEQLKARRNDLQDALDALLDASKVKVHRDGWFAADGSSSWSWGRSPRKPQDDVDVRSQEEVDETDPDERIRDEDADRSAAEAADSPTDSDGHYDIEHDGAEPVEDDGDDEPGRARKRPVYDYDAAFGSKTAHAGGREGYFGYVIDALVRIAPPGQPAAPMVIERLVISPASTDVVQPTFRLLDSLATSGTEITDLVVDRHYSFKKVERWADELRARNINQHFDLRKKEQGFSDFNGAKLVAGWAHCPATPAELGDIPKPGPNADKAAWKKFNAKIAERERLAMARDERPNDKGRARFTCPAIDGKVGCPLRPDTMAVAEANGLPIVTDAPDPDTAPACCTNSSGKVTVNDPQLRKHDQPFYWGSKQWQAAYDRRTYVEGVFGSIKSGRTEGVGREFTRHVGLVMVSIGLTVAAVVANIRHQRKTANERGEDLDHPLLSEDTDYAAVVYLTADEVAELDRRHHSDETNVA